MIVPQDPAQEGEKKNEYDELLSQEADAPRNALKRSFHIAGQRDPERFSKVLDLSAKTRLPTDLVERRFKEVSQDHSAPSDDEYDQLLRTARKTAGWASRPDNASLVRDDVAAIAALELKWQRTHGVLKPFTDAEMLQMAEHEYDGRIGPMSPSREIQVNTRDRKPLPENATFEQRIQELIDTMPMTAAGPIGASGVDPHDPEFRKRMVAGYLENIKKENAFVAVEGKIGFGETIGVKAPFASSIFTAIEAREIKDAMGRLKKGEGSEFDTDLVVRATRKMMATESRGYNVGGIVGMGLAELTALIPEFALGGPLFKLGFGAVTAGTRAGLSALIRNRLTGALVGAALQTPVSMGPRVLAGTIQRMTPQVQLATDEVGQIQAVIGDSKDDFTSAFLKSAGEQYVEVLTEYSGVLLVKMLAPIKAAMIRRWLWLNPTKGVAGLVSKLKSVTGWHGVLPEIFEERLSEVGKAALGIEDYKPPSPEQLLAEVITFAVPGAAFGALERIGHSDRAMPDVSALNALKNLGEKVKETKLYQRSPEKLKEAIHEQVEGTPSEFVYSPVKSWTEYWQGRNEDPRLKAIEYLGTASQYEEAAKTGVDLKIPMAVYAVDIAPEHGSFFQKEIRTEPGQMTAREGEVRQNAQPEKPPAVAEPTPEEKARSERKKRVDDQLAKIMTPFEEGVRKAGRSPVEARAARQVLEAGVRTLSEREGINPQEIFKSRRLQVRRVEGSVEATPEALEKVFEQGDKFQQPSNEAVDAAFAKVAEQVWTEKLKPRQAIPFSRTPEAFKLIGAPDLPMKITAEVILKARNDHNLDPEIIMDLPKKIRDPLMIFESRTEPNALVVLMETMFKGKAVVAAVHLDRGEEHYKVNRIASVHDRPVEHIGNWIGQDLLRYWDEKRAKAWLQSAGVQSPGEGTKPSTGRVRSKDELSKGNFEEGPIPETTGGKRGRLTIGRVSIDLDLLSGADPSTVFHELGHFYLAMVGELVSTGKASERLIEDFGKIREWLGVKESEAISKEQHETFARGFEKYLFEGKAPSPALGGAFYRVKQWLLGLYKNAQGYFSGVVLTPEVRGVFDRLLATEQEIEAARAEQNQQPLFEDLKAIGMNDVQAEDYAKAIDESHRAASDGLAEQTMEVLRKKQDALWAEERGRIREQLAKEVDQRPEYVTLSILANGTKPDGTEIQWAREGFRFSREDLKERYADIWPSERLEPFVLREKGRQADDPDVVAELLQSEGVPVTSGHQLLKMITEIEPRDALLDRMADSKMDELHPELLADPDALRKAATEQVYGDKEAVLLRRELAYLASEHFAKFKGLAQAIIGDVPTPKELKDEAAAAIGAKTSRQLEPALYERAAARAARNASEAFLSGDLQGAFNAKREQLLNLAYFREATKAQEQLRKIASFMRKAGRDSRLRALGRAGHDYLEQVEDILERFDFMPASLRTVEKRESLRDWYEKEKAAGREPIVPEKLLDKAYRRHWKDVPYDELVDIYKTTENIVHLAQTKNKLLTAARKREFDATVGEITGSIAEVFKGKTPKTESLGEKSAGEDVYGKLAEWGTGLRKFSSLAQELDGFKNGIVWETIVLPLNQAQEQEQDRNLKDGKRLGEIFSDYSRKDRRRMHRKVYVPEISRSISLWDMIGIAGHWGSEGNRERVMADYGWSESQVRAVLAHLQERDFKTAQDLADLANSSWPETKALAQEVDGIPPEKVEAAPFEITSADGKLIKQRGGYWPIRRKSDPSKPHMSIEELADASIRGDAFRATTRHGHRKERTGLGGGAVRFELGVMVEHLRDVNHDLTHYRWLVDANRLLRNGQVMQTIKETLGPAGHQEMLDTVKAVAVNNRQQVRGIDRFVEWVTHKTRAAVLAWNVKTILKQYLGFGATVDLLGVDALRGAMAAGIGLEGIRNVEEWIQKNSLFMKNRLSSQSREQSEVFSELKGPNFSGPIPTAFREVERLGFFGIGWTQWHVDKATWLGAYQKYARELEFDKVASAEARDTLQKRIFAMADQAVRDTQGSGLLGDMPAALRARGTMRAFTLFKTFSINLLNRYIQRGREFEKKRDVASAVKLGLLFFETTVAPAIAWEILTSLVWGGGDDDKESLVARATRKGVIGGVQDLAWSLPVVGEGLDLGVDALQGKPFDYDGPQGLAVINDFVTLMRQIGQGEDDKALWRSLARFVGDFGVPGMRQADATFTGFLDWQEEEAGPGAVLLGPPPKRK